ncbi:MAG: hypothetical protein KAJ13_12500 [Gemmatimonadetes bacterium]|nr:hypothetical protein [Gemmatimonadota bacterium]MCK5484524.1 hypothetical protein [Gemmatimonadota bacterium]
MIRRNDLAIALVVLVTVPAGFGCAGESQSSTVWDGSVRDSAGVTIVENFGTPLWQEEDRWSLSEVLKIGSLEGEPEYQFGRISGLRMLSDGRIVVADAHAHRVRFFSPDGVHQRTVGTTGSGPREFGSGSGLNLITSGDTVMVWDGANGQVHWLGPDGTWLGSWRTVPKDGWVMRTWDDAPTGRVVTQMTPLRVPDSPVTDTLDILLIRDVRGGVSDTLGRVPSTKTFSRSGDTPEWHMYAGDPDFDLTWEGGVVAGRSDRYRLSVYDANGDLERIISLVRERLPFTDRDRSLLLGRLEDQLREDGVPQGRVAQLKSAFHFEDTYPAFRRFLSGPLGTVWVQHVRPLTALSDDELENWNAFSLRPPGAPEWDVFDREGRYLGVVIIPPQFDPRFKGDKIYGIWEDELEVQHVLITRIEGLPPPDDG